MMEYEAAFGHSPRSTEIANLFTIEREEEYLEQLSGEDLAWYQAEQAVIRGSSSDRRISPDQSIWTGQVRGCAK
jgi:hypothetical protein